MKRYKVTYLDGDDVCTVWVSAIDAENAKFQVMQEYWDCKDIIDVMSME